MLTRLPLFPLSVVLFPGTPLPLHIFEPRYCRMLTDCLASDRRFGITPTGTLQEAPEAGTVGCTAEVRVNQQLPDGRSNIVVLGGERFVVAELLDEPVPYHVGMVQTFDDDPGTLPDQDRTARLREQFTRYAVLVRQLGVADPEKPDLPDEALPLSFHVAAGIEVEVPIKQRLLAERSTARRVEALLVILPALSSAVERALVIHRRAPTNGRGGTYPGLPIA